MRRDIPFNLTLDDFRVPSLCPALGIPLKRGGKSTDDSPTIDRNIPSKGYVKGNVTIISGLANRIKTNATLEQIEKVARWLKGVLENSSH